MGSHLTAAPEHEHASTESVLGDTLHSIEEIGDMLSAVWHGKCSSYGVESIFGASAKADFDCGDFLALGGEEEDGEPMRAVVSAANIFPSLENVVEREVFSDVTASEFLTKTFGEGAPMSMKKFHTERGDDDAWFETWRPIATSSQLEHGQSQSLIDEVPNSLLSKPTLERRGSFRTPVRLPAAGKSITEITVVQRILHLENVDGSNGERVVYVVESVMRLLDVPYSDRFRVVVRKTFGDADDPAIKSDDNSLCGCPNNVCAPELRQEPGQDVPCHTSPSTTLRLEFEIQFERGCQFYVEDRIKKMLTKKVGKLLKSWSRWVRSGCLLDRVLSTGHSTFDTAEERDDVGPGSLLPYNSWEPLWQGENGSRDDSTLLWSMTEIDSEDDDIEDDISTSKGSFLLMEWRDKSLNEIDTDVDEKPQDVIYHRGIGVELCLSDNEGGALGTMVTETRYSFLPKSQASCGIEVVYVNESSSSANEEASFDEKVPVPHPSIKTRSRSNFQRRRTIFRRQKKIRLG